MAELTEAQREFLDTCEKEFSKRYTSEDKAFMQVGDQTYIHFI